MALVERHDFDLGTAEVYSEFGRLHFCIMIHRGDSDQAAFQAWVYLLRRAVNLPLREVAQRGKVSPSQVSKIQRTIETSQPYVSLRRLLDGCKVKNCALYLFPSKDADSRVPMFTVELVDCNSHFDSNVGRHSHAAKRASVGKGLPTYYFLFKRYGPLVAAVCFSLAACASTTPHENFINSMQVDIGRSAYDSSVYRNRVRSLFLGTKSLPNGNIEDEFKAGRRLNCRVYFEIDKKAEKIVGWRYKGTKQDCVIVP